MKKLNILITSYLKNALPAHAAGSEYSFAILNLLIPVLTGLYIFLNPLPFSSLKEICYYLSCTIVIILLYFKKTQFTLRWPLTLPFALFFIWAMIGLSWSLDWINSLHDLRGHLLEYLIIFYLLVNYFNSPKKLQWLFRLIVLSVTVFSVGAMIHYYGMEGFPFSERLGLRYLDMSTNNIGFVIISSIPLAVSEFQQAGKLKSRLFFLFCIVILCVAALLTQSRAALIGLFIALVIMCLNNKKFIFLVGAVILFVAIMPGAKDRILHEGITTDNRVKIAHLTLEVIKDHPIGGIGFGMQIYENESLINLKAYNNRLPEKFQQNPIMPSPHNTLLDITLRTGIVGLLLYLSILATALFLLWKTYRNVDHPYFRSQAVCLFACFMASTVAALFQDTASGAKAVTYHAILAMITILWKLSTDVVDGNEIADSPIKSPIGFQP